MNKPPSPKSLPAVNPYETWYQDDSGVPTTPAAPQGGERSLMRLYVPSENTLVDLGHGNTTPGIRMSTDNHVHLTARAPRTTISLGSPGGDGIGDAAMGLQVFTAGEKRETIDGSTVEWYKNAKTEHVLVGLTNRYNCPKDEIITGGWLQQCDDAKTETVKGTVTENYAAEHNLTVGKQAVHRFEAGKVDSVGADWVVDVKGHKHEEIQGDSKNITLRKQNTLFVGEKVAVSVGLSIALNVGGTYSASIADQRSALAGNKFEIVRGAGVAINLATKVSKDNVAVSRANATYKASTFELTKEDVALGIRSNQISSAAMTIFK